MRMAAEKATVSVVYRRRRGLFRSVRIPTWETSCALQFHDMKSFAAVSGGEAACSAQRSAGRRVSTSMKPTAYGDLSGTSGVAYYGIGDEFIAVQFDDDTIYLYSYLRPGQAHVQQMKQLAVAGSGLATYINQHVRGSFDRTFPNWASVRNV
jgi:hypothetical protein